MDCVGCIYQNNSRLLQTVTNVVANPVYIVFELAAPNSGVKDRIDFKLLHTVHSECWRRGHDAAGERICHVGLQEADMKLLNGKKLN